MWKVWCIYINTLTSYEMQVMFGWDGNKMEKYGSLKIHSLWVGNVLTLALVVTGVV